MVIHVGNKNNPQNMVETPEEALELLSKEFVINNIIFKNV